ncbi:MAG: hypothetical protein ABI999_01565 [Acidobacteriota bacterium]
MKFVSEKEGIGRLSGIREAFRAKIAGDFEHRAKPCITCETPGACCLDAHFVNVRISWLEAAAIRVALSRLGPEFQARVYARIECAADGLSERETYACPLFEKGIGCLVHDDAKPLPCIQHACYERKEDLPPDELLEEAERRIDRLNQRVYGTAGAIMPLPVTLMQD